MKCFFFLVIGPILCVAQGKSLHSVTGKIQELSARFTSLMIPAEAVLLILD